MVSLYKIPKKSDRNMDVQLKGRPLVSGVTQSKTLVSKKPLSFLDGVDPEKGVIIEEDHD